MYKELKVISVGLFLVIFSISASAEPSDLYYKNKVKWKSKHSNNDTVIYRYIDEDDIGTINRYRSNQNVDIGEVNISRHSKVREVHTVIDLDNLDINVDKGSKAMST